MISLEDLVLTDELPIYLQIMAYIKRGVVSGAIGDGGELPSRRAVSALLGVNPNTVQKAYFLLEEEGVVSSRAGARSFVTAPPEIRERLRRELMSEAARRYVSELRRMGVSRDEAGALLERFWEREAEK